MKVKCGKKWKSMRMGTWAGGYTKEFAVALIRGAENFLKERWPHGKTNLSYPVEETQVPNEVPEPPVIEEEQFMTLGDEQDGDWSENEIPASKRDEVLQRVPPEVRKEV